MTYWDFLRLDWEQRLDVALEQGEYVGEDLNGRSIYQVEGFWVLLTENEEGEYSKIEATRQEPETA